MDEDRFERDRATIRAELERRARAGQLITYGEAAGMVGRASQGLGRILDAIGAEEAARGAAPSRYGDCVQSMIRREIGRRITTSSRAPQGFTLCHPEIDALKNK